MTSKDNDSEEKAAKTDANLSDSGKEEEKTECNLLEVQVNNNLVDLKKSIQHPVIKFI